MNGVTLDAGGLIALDRDDRRVIALLARAAEIGATVTVPAPALAQAMRRPAKQARLSRLVRQPTTLLAPLDGPDATRVGVLSQPMLLAVPRSATGRRPLAQPNTTAASADLHAPAR
jgi:hypothetical protein